MTGHAHVGRDPRQNLIDMFAAVDRKDWNEVERFLHPDVVYSRPGYQPLIGAKAVMHFYREVRVLSSGIHEIQGIAVDGDVGSSWGRFVGTTRDGKPVDLEYAEWYLFTDGRISSRKSYFFTPLA